jgi:hypothetical protein
MIMMTTTTMVVTTLMHGYHQRMRNYG